MKHWAFWIVWWLLSNAAWAAVRDGHLDLSQVKAGAKTKIELNGSWRFYPKVFLETQDFQGGWPADQPFTLLPIPGPIVGLPGPDGQPLPHDVWGSFVLELKHMPSAWKTDLGLRLRGDTAYKVYLIDPAHPEKTQLVAQAGLPGPRPQESIPRVIDQLGRFPAPQGEGPFYLVVHISGFFYVGPSLWVTPTLGPIRLLEQERDWIRLSECLVIGMLLIMTLYNFSLYLHRYEDRGSLWLAAFCALMTIRFVSTSGFVTAQLFPRSHVDLFEAIRKVEFAAMGLAASCLLVFIVLTFGYTRWKPYLIWNHIPVLLLTGWIAVTDATVYPRLLPLIMGHSLLVSLTVLGLVIGAVRQRRKGSWLALGGMFAVVAGGWHDILIGLNLVQTPIFLMPYGMVALIFSQGQVIARHFAAAFRTADRLSRNLADEVERQTLAIRSMLDHIPQGVMNLVAPGVIDADFSRHLCAILAQDAIAGRTLDEALLSRCVLTPDDRERIQAALNSCLGEEELAFELNCAQLPMELHLKLADDTQKILHMTWNPVVDRSGVIAKILITCHDVTEMRRYEAEANEKKDELAFIEELVEVTAPQFAVFYETSGTLLAEIKRLIEQNPARNSEILKILFVNMHTIKGAARTLGFSRLTSCLHEVEQCYAALLNDPNQIWDQARLLKELASVEALMVTYQRVNAEKLGRVQESSRLVPVDREFLMQHTHLLEELEREGASNPFSAALYEALIRFEALTFLDVHKVLQELTAAAEKVARDLGKVPPVIVIRGLHCGISHQGQQLLRKVLIHLMRNALDHGIETVEERLKCGKKPEGTITFTLTEVEQQLQIAIRDDGRGLSLARLARRGRELGLLPVAATASAGQLAALIFHPGLSTADTLTEVSGRGIGMDAVKRFVEEAGGTIRIEVESSSAQAEYCSFVLIISLPSSLYLHRSVGPMPQFSSAS